MSTLQTSLNTPLPTTNGQLLIGHTGSLPSVNTLTAGNSVAITNGAGSVTLGITGYFGVIWQNSTPTTMTAFNGYINNSTTGTYTLPSSPNFGDIYIVLGLGFSFVITASAPNQHIYFGAASGTHLTTSNAYSDITVLCANANPANMQFTVLSTTATEFTLS